MRASPPPPERGGGLAQRNAQALLRRGAPVPWAIGALSLALIIAVVIGSLAVRTRILAEAQRELFAITDSVAYATERNLLTQDAALRRIGARMSRIDPLSSTGAHLAFLTMADEHATAVAVLAMRMVAADGRIIASSQAGFAPANRAMVDQTSNLASALAIRHDAPLLSFPGRGDFEASRDRAVMVLSRPIVAASEIIGVTESLLSLEPGDGLLPRITLGDGTVLALHSMDGAVLIQTVSGEAATASHDARDPMVMAQTSLTSFGLSVVASRPQAAVLATWQQSTALVSTVALLLAVAGIWVAWLARWATRRQASLVAEVERRDAIVSAITDTVDAVLWSMDARNREWLHISPSIERLTGYPQAFFTTRPDAWLDIVHPDDRALAAEAFRGSPEQVLVEYRVRTAWGE